MVVHIILDMFLLSVYIVLISQKNNVSREIGWTLPQCKQTDPGLNLIKLLGAYLGT